MTKNKLAEAFDELEKYSENKTRKDMEVFLGEDEVKELESKSLDDDDDKFIEWYTRELSLIHKEKEVLERQHERRIAALSRRQKAVEYFGKERAIEIATIMIENKKGRGKHIDLPYGRFKITDRKPTIKIADASKLMEVAEDFFTKEEYEKVVDTTPRIRANEAKKLIEYDGLVVIFPTGETFNAKAAEKYGIEAIGGTRTVEFGYGLSATTDGGQDES